MDNVFKRPSTQSATATRLFMLLLVVCLAECVTEQRINNRGSKSSHIVDKINGWRSQRGGSCLSYGHSCWGAHGKRSGKPPATAPDWYLSKILRRIAANAEMNRENHLPTKTEDIRSALQMELGEAPSTDRLITRTDNSLEDLPYSRNPEAKPMLDENMLSKMKIWQIMREVPEEK